MKRIFLMLIITSVSLLSCKSVYDGLVDKPKVFLDCELGVAEQVNVSHYIIEISTDGKTWESIGMIMATELQENVYKIPVDVTRYHTPGKTIYARAYSVDIDGTILYSSIASAR